MDDDELAGYADDAVARFGDEADVLVVELADGAVMMRFSLSQLVDDLLDVMQTESEVDDMLDMARHFASLSKRISKAVSEYTEGGS